MNEFNEIPLSEEQINQLYQEFRQRARMKTTSLTEKGDEFVDDWQYLDIQMRKLSIKKQEKLQQELFTSQQASNILLKKKSQTKSWRSLYGKRFLENIRSKGPAQNNQYWGFREPIKANQLVSRSLHIKRV